MFPMVVSSHLDHDQVVSSLLQSGPIVKEGFEKQLTTSSVSLPSLVQTSKVELKPLPHDLKYAFIGEGKTFSVVILLDLDEKHEDNHLQVLKEYKSVIGWAIIDIKEISPSVCTNTSCLDETWVYDPGGIIPSLNDPVS